MGFEINPYDLCVANKTANGTQMTIRWHVDDFMISHLSQDEIMKVVQGIKDIYGESLAERYGASLGGLLCDINNPFLGLKNQ